mgnify:CR=1 FL=1
MIKFKQKELVDEMFYTIKEKFPEIEMVNITESPEDPSDLWLNITAPKDEEREIELREFASEKATDILLDYGYHISVMPTKKFNRSSACPSMVVAR